MVLSDVEDWIYRVCSGAVLKFGRMDIRITIVLPPDQWDLAAEKASSRLRFPVDPSTYDQLVYYYLNLRVPILKGQHITEPQVSIESKWGY